MSGDLNLEVPDLPTRYSHHARPQVKGGVHGTATEAGAADTNNTKAQMARAGDLFIYNVRKQVKSSRKSDMME